jgi:hypothetical protein
MIASARIITSSAPIHIPANAYAHCVNGCLSSGNSAVVVHGATVGIDVQVVERNPDVMARRLTGTSTPSWRSA